MSINPNHLNVFVPFPFPIPESTSWYHRNESKVPWITNRPQGIMLQIFFIILFRISSKIVSLCSLLFPKCTHYSHCSQLYYHWYFYSFSSLLQSKCMQQYFVVAYTIQSVSVIAYYNSCCSQPVYEVMNFFALIILLE